MHKERCFSMEDMEECEEGKGGGGVTSVLSAT